MSCHCLVGASVLNSQLHEGDMVRCRTLFSFFVKILLVSSYPLDHSQSVTVSTLHAQAAVTQQQALN